MDKPIFYEGQEVGCLMFGKGIVLCIDTTLKHPINIMFENSNERYLLDGRISAIARPTLYPIEQYHSIVNNISSPEPEKWQPKPGEWCLFWDECNYDLVLSRFRGMHGIKFQSNIGSTWQYCAPFTGELPEHLKEVQP